MISLKPIWAVLTLGLLAQQASAAGPGGFEQQLITLPAAEMRTFFSDIETNGRPALVALDADQNRVLIYRQSATGFSNVAAQSIPLPPQTIWVTPYDVDPHPGLELLISTASGLSYLRQDDGVFETNFRSLVHAPQVFTNVNTTYLFRLRTNDVIPIISSTQAVVYRRNPPFAWKPDPPQDLRPGTPSWSVGTDDWKMGPDAAHRLSVSQSHRVDNGADRPAEQGNETIKNLVKDLSKAAPMHPPDTLYADIDGDGREDVVVWQVLGDFESRTEIHIFLRGADGKLPTRPTQTLRCRGTPVPSEGSGYRWSPFIDLRGDGKRELVLIEAKASLLALDSLLDAVLSQGMNLLLTVRTFQNGAFSHSPDASVTVTGMLNGGPWEEWPSFSIGGDFNGDGRPDLLLRRSRHEWKIFFSAKDGRWFESQPSVTFTTSIEGYFTLRDLNGDGLTDIVLQANDDPRMFLYLSQSQPTKGDR